MKKLLVLFLLFSTIADAQQFKKKTSWGRGKEGTNLIITATSIGAAVGDEVTLWPENGRMFPGPDGAWPYKWYPSFASMFADRFQKPGTWACVLGEKGLFRYNESWNGVQGGVLDCLAPFALTFKVTKITSGGKYLYIDKTLKSTAKRARLTFDNTQKIYDHVKKTRSFDAKKLGFKRGDTLWCARRLYWGPESPSAANNWEGWRPHNIKILGNGITFASPDGTTPMSVCVEEGNGTPQSYFADLNIVQNGTYDGIGLPRPDIENYATGLPMTNEPFGDIWLYAPAFGNWNKGATCLRDTVYNAGAYAYEHGNLINCASIMSARSFKQYNGWAFHGDSMIGCYFYSPHLMRGWEPFKGNNRYIKNCVSINGLLAANATQNTLIEDFTLHLTENCAEENPVMLTNPAVDVNNRLSYGQDAGDVVFNRVKIQYQGYLTKNGGVIRGFVLDNANRVIIRNSSISRPDVISPWEGNNTGTHFLGNADGNHLIENSTFTGKMHPWSNANCSYNSASHSPFTLKGKGKSIIRNVTAEQFTVGPDVLLENVKSSCPTVRFED